MAISYTYWNPNLIADYNIAMRGIIHIGAHYGQEYADYIKYGMRDIIFIEPLIANYTKLLELTPKDAGIKTFNMALGNTTGTIDMFVETANSGMSSSILEPGTHLETYPFITFDTKETVKIDKLDNIEFDRSLYNVLNIDVQGYELEVLKGSEDTLKYIDAIFTEINVGEVYKGCGKLEDLDAFLIPRGYKRAFTNIYDKILYGDAIYVKQ